MATTNIFGGPIDHPACNTIAAKNLPDNQKLVGPYVMILRDDDTVWKHEVGMMIAEPATENDREYVPYDWGYKVLA